MKMIVRRTALAVCTLVLAVILPTAASAACTGFDDVPESADCYESVMYLAKCEIVAGMGNECFSPEQLITVEQWAVMLCRAYGVETIGDNWQDVGRSSVVEAYRQGWLNETALSAPRSPMCRSVLVESAFAAADVPVYDSTLYKGGASLSTADNILRVGRELGLCSDDADTNALVTRGEAAIILHAVLTQSFRIEEPPVPVALVNAAGVNINDYLLALRQVPEPMLAAFNAAGVKFAQEILDYVVASGSATADDSVAAQAANWGFDLADDATVEDFWAAIVAKYGYDISDDGINAETAGTSISSFLEAELGDAYTDYTVAVQTGESAPNVAGIVKTGDYSMTVTLTEVNATAIYQLPVTVCPMHYYGETDKYDYDNNMFGFVKGDLSHVKSVTSTPIGSGPYTFESWSNGAVTLQKNPTYWKGEPKIDTVIWREMTDEEKTPGVVSGTIDVTDPSYSKEAAEQIKEANSNGEISGDTIQTDLVANLGYGYVGFNANRVKVGDGNGGDEASKDLRKAIATVIAVYRDVAVDSYYGEFANVINYPISDTSWAAPRVTDEGYKVAFSVDVNGNDIYTEGMSADDKYAAAKQAALGYFEAAGYTVADGKITAAPAGGRMDAEVMVGGSGKGDHPSFMALTLASDALKEIGFNLIVSDMSNFAEMTNAINAGTADMFAMAWQATPDPDMFQIYHSKGGSNEKSYWIKDADLDELIMMARQSTDQTYRKTLYKQCLDIVADWAVEIPIYQRQNCVIFSAKRVNLDTVTPDITTYWAWYNDIELLDLQ